MRPVLAWAKSSAPEPWLGWLPLFVLPALVLAITPATLPRWASMWTLAGAIFVGLCFTKKSPRE